MAANTFNVTSTTSPELASTIDDFIASGKDAPLLTYYNFSILQVEYSTDKTIRFDFTSDNLITDYLDIFKENAQEVKMTTLEQRKYYYNPDLLSYDLYGTTELDFVIMLMNGVIDSKEFTIPTLKLIPKTTLINLMSSVYNAESEYLRINRDNYHLNMPGE
jgi:hypothetical protein